MPLYEYHCPSCDARFEKLVRGGAAPACPGCGATEVKKLHSAFAVGADRGRASGGSMGAVPPMAAGGCGTCGDPRGPGACALDN
jgi:putative FmdB family regulatory protein